MRPDDLLRELDELFQPSRFKDYAPNGLQVEGTDSITTIATAATASQAAIAAAVEAGADALLVHHGIFWGREQRLTGMLGARVRALVKADCALFAYHLPLDAQPLIGNNAVGLELLGIHEHTAFGDQDLGRWGTLAEAIDAATLSERCQRAFAHPVLHCPGGPERIRRVGIVTGGGQSYLASGAAAGIDAFITGETSEQTWHEAQELGIHCFACGHYATEDHAIHRLGADLAQRHGLTHHAYRPMIPV
jgi:dinuclear metal center YbgI/SA1388 family protein